ncbi:probable RNA-directed DNA polymerase from transposon X-element [Aspergillus udagawae]|nr:probable RNA-directed DNA polymerase from transposon X-element [Aspergillus udagawae]
MDAQKLYLKIPSQIEDAASFLIKIIYVMVKLTRLYHRVYTGTHTKDDWIAYTKVRNQKGKVISKSLQRSHRRQVQQTINDGPRGMWRIAKWAQNRQGGGQTGIILILYLGDCVAETAEQKAKLLYKTFFPPPPTADLSDIEGHIYNQAWDIAFPDINKYEITKAIRRAPPDKAPGPDTIPNKHFQVSIIVVLRKAAPRDFHLPKSYYPIALLNTLGKVLESIVASCISWALEEYRLLLKGHLGGRKGVLVDHTIQLILYEVHWAWGHSYKFAPDKFKLIHFTNPKEPEPARWSPPIGPTDTDTGPTDTGPTDTRPTDIWDPYEQEGHDLMPIQHQNTTIQPTESARYLSVWLDKTLSFDTHRTQVINRANGSLEALRSITGSTWGASLTAMRAIYCRIVIPQLLYGVAAWFSPVSRLFPATDQSKIINEFTKIQKRAAILISGAFQGTAAAALNMELHLLLIRLQIQQTIEETAIRI